MPGLEDLNKTIKRFEEASETLREESRLAHEAAKAAKEQRRLLEQTRKEVVDSIEEKFGSIVSEQLKAVAEASNKAAEHTYTKVGAQIDILVNTALGKHLSRSGRHEDLRPALAIKLREWIEEELEKMT